MAIEKSSLENRLSPRSSWGDLQKVIEEKEEHNSAFREKANALVDEAYATQESFKAHTICRVTELQQFSEAFHLNEHVKAEERGTHTLTESYQAVLDSLHPLFINQTSYGSPTIYGANVVKWSLLDTGPRVKPQSNSRATMSSLTKRLTQAIPPLGNFLARRDFAHAQDRYNALLHQFYDLEQDLGYHIRVLDALVEELPANKHLNVSLASRSYLHELDPAATRERLHHFTDELRWLRENPFHLDVPQYFSFGEDLAANAYETHFPDGDGIAVVTSLGDAVNSPRVLWSD